MEQCSEKDKRRSPERAAITFRNLTFPTPIPQGAERAETLPGPKGTRPSLANSVASLWSLRVPWNHFVAHFVATLCRMEAVASIAELSPMTYRIWASHRKLDLALREFEQALSVVDHIGKKNQRAGLVWLAGISIEIAYNPKPKARQTMITNHNRREFLRITAAATVSAAWLQHTSASAAAERSASYAGPIIDTHTHFYDPTRAQGVPWPPKDDSLLYRRVLPPDYIALLKPQTVTGTVVVEASPWVEDNQWILDLAARQPFIVGFVGNLALGTADFRANVNRFAANPLFRGIRIGADQVRQALRQPRFRDDLKLLADRDLAVDLLGGQEMLADVPKLAAGVPNLRFMIDHVANIQVSGGATDQTWRDGMKAAGASPRVYCKVSGLVEGTGRSDGKAPSDAGFYGPILDTIWEAFGPDRLVYGSNWPVSERFAPCAVVQGIVADYFNAKEEGAAEKVFFKNSQDVYKWVKRH